MTKRGKRSSSTTMEEAGFRIIFAQQVTIEVALWSIKKMLIGGEQFSFSKAFCVKYEETRYDINALVFIADSCQQHWSRC